MDYNKMYNSYVSTHPVRIWVIEFPFNPTVCGAWHHPQSSRILLSYYGGLFSHEFTRASPELVATLYLCRFLRFLLEGLNLDLDSHSHQLKLYFFPYPYSS